MANPTGIVSAVLIAAAAIYVGWLAAGAVALEMLSGQTARVSALAAGRPDAVLGAAMTQFATSRGKLDPVLLPPVRRAAAQLPLDARPYALIGSNYLRLRDTRNAIATLEAGRRLDPRQRWINLLLLEHYLRTRQYPIAAEEMALLARLVGDAQGPIAAALAQMSIAPQTRDAARLTLDQDPALEQSVLTAMANSKVQPAVIFQMASPAALALANAPNGWGSALVDRLVRNHAYGAARAVWQRIGGIDARQPLPLLYNADLRQLPAKPPFNWRIASDNIAAADLRDRKLEIDYYGRDTGDLASQLLVLTPGSYRFSFVVNGVQQHSASTLVWSITCDNAPDRALARSTIAAAPNVRRLAIPFTVTADCPAQWLKLSGLAGEFPAPVSATIDNLKLERVAAK